MENFVTDLVLEEAKYRASNIALFIQLLPNMWSMALEKQLKKLWKILL